MINKISYLVTGYIDNMLLVRLTLNGHHENVRFPFDGSVPIKTLLEQRAAASLVMLKNKVAPSSTDLLQFVGTKGDVLVPDQEPVGPPPGQPVMVPPSPPAAE